MLRKMLSLSDQAKQMVKPRYPVILKKMDNVDEVEHFITEWRTFEKQADTTNVSIDDYIYTSLFKKLELREPRVFRRGKTESILKGLEDWVEKQKEYTIVQIAVKANALEFVKPKTVNLETAALNFVADGQELYNKCGNNTALKQHVFRQVVLKLPDRFRIDLNKVMSGELTNFPQLRSLIKDRAKEIYGLEEERLMKNILQQQSVMNGFSLAGSVGFSTSGGTGFGTSGGTGFGALGGGSTVAVNQVDKFGAYAVTFDEDEVHDDELECFVVEENTAHRAFICYGCKQPGHIRRNCPIATNRRGRPRRLLGTCFNCNKPGHQWRNCSAPLSHHLSEQRQKNIVKWASGQSNAPIAPLPSPSKASTPAPAAQKAVQVEDFVQALADVKEQLEQLKATSNDVKVCAVSDDLSKDVEVDADGVVVFDPCDPAIFVFRQGKWQRVVGKVDTGADSSMGSYQHHRHLCDKVWERVGPMKYAVTADKHRVPIKYNGLARVKLNNTEIGLVMLHLVDSNSWRFLLVGKDVLAKNNLLPVIP